jgi:hypothetical protein
MSGCGKICKVNVLLWYYNLYYSKIRSCMGLVVPVGGGRMWGKDVGGLIWWKYCLHMNENEKVRSVETIPGMGGGEDKGE